MRRREFIHRAVTGVGATWLAQRMANAKSFDLKPLPQKFQAHDDVVLGNTGIRTSRLAIGTGTHGSGKASNQTRIRNAGLTRLLVNGYHEHGLRFYDTADAYGSHPYIAAALKQVPRDKITVLTKTDTRDAAGVRADLERYRRELGVDYIDVVLIHCVTEDDWPTRYQGIMDVLSEAKQKGVIRAHGVSCHAIGALRAAAASPWVDLDLVRINPVQAYMDADPDTVLSVIRQMRASGKAVVGMKILGQGAMRSRPGEALHFALGTGALDAFTIGAESQAEQNDLVRRIAAA